MKGEAEPSEDLSEGEGSSKGSRETEEEKAAGGTGVPVGKATPFCLMSVHCSLAGKQPGTWKI